MTGIRDAAAPDIENMVVSSRRRLCLIGVLLQGRGLVRKAAGMTNDTRGHAVTVPERLETDRLILERLRPEHRDDLGRMHRDPQVMATLGGVRSAEGDGARPGGVRSHTGSDTASAYGPCE